MGGGGGGLGEEKSSKPTRAQIFRFFFRYKSRNKKMLILIFDHKRTNFRSFQD